MIKFSVNIKNDIVENLQHSEMFMETLVTLKTRKRNRQDGCAQELPFHWARAREKKEKGKKGVWTVNEIRHPLFLSLPPPPSSQAPSEHLPRARRVRPGTHRGTLQRCSALTRWGSCSFLCAAPVVSIYSAWPHAWSAFQLCLEGICGANYPQLLSCFLLGICAL